jgi:hypothetical protein
MLFRLNLGYERDTGSNSNYCRSVSKRSFLTINPFVRSSLLPLRSSLFCCSFRLPTLPYILNDVFFFSFPLFLLTLPFLYSFPYDVNYFESWSYVSGVHKVRSKPSEEKKKKLDKKKWGMQSQFHYSLPDLPCCRQAQRLCRKMREPCLKGWGILPNPLTTSLTQSKECTINSQNDIWMYYKSQWELICRVTPASRISQETSVKHS